MRYDRKPTFYGATDLIKSGKVDLSDVRFFVLDEADRLVSQAEDAAAISDLYSKLPKAVHRLQVLMFSATLHSPEITDMSQKICKFPTWVDLKGKESVPEVRTCHTHTRHARHARHTPPHDALLLLTRPVHL